MEIRRDRKFYLYVGRDFYSCRPFCIFIGLGKREDAAEGDIIFKWWWKWSPRFPQIIWNGWKPVGYSTFGRTRIFR